jgi:hypothetical protein
MAIAAGGTRGLGGGPGAIAGRGDRLGVGPARCDPQTPLPGVRGLKAGGRRRADGPPARREVAGGSFCGRPRAPARPPGPGARRVRMALAQRPVWGSAHPPPRRRGRRARSVARRRVRPARPSKRMGRGPGTPPFRSPVACAPASTCGPGRAAAATVAPTATLCPRCAGRPAARPRGRARPCTSLFQGCVRATRRGRSPDERGMRRGGRVMVQGERGLGLHPGRRGRAGSGEGSRRPCAAARAPRRHKARCPGGVRHCVATLHPIPGPARPWEPTARPE